MNTQRYSHIVLVIGEGKVWSSLIAALLNDNACVFAPVKDMEQFKILHHLHSAKGKLITELVDIADYKRAESFAKEFIAKYGNIDLVCVFEDPRYITEKYFSNIHFSEFEKVVNDNIINIFIFFKIVLDSMKKDNSGMFIHIHDCFVKREEMESPVNIFINKAQTEIKNIFLRELEKAKVKYLYAPLKSLQASSEKITLNYILNLCE